MRSQVATVVKGAAGTVLRAPLISIFLVARALERLPRRQVNLRRWTRSQEFGDLRREAVAWLDRHFELIERGAPWLVAGGASVTDVCSAFIGNASFGQMGTGAGTESGRKVTVVYGFGGPLIPLLRSLDQAFPVAGWQLGTQASRQSWADLDPEAASAATGLARSYTRWMTDRSVTLEWHPTEALGYPPGLDRMRPCGLPPFRPAMTVTWASRGQDIGWRMIEDAITMRDVTRNLVPLEVSELKVPQLLEGTLARYEHALAVTIGLAYYVNLNPKVRPYRMRRHVIPTRPRR